MVTMEKKSKRTKRKKKLPCPIITNEIRNCRLQLKITSKPPVQEKQYFEELLNALQKRMDTISYSLAVCSNEENYIEDPREVLNDLFIENDNLEKIIATLYDESRRQESCVFIRKLGRWLSQCEQNDKQIQKFAGNFLNNIALLEEENILTARSRN
jgi:hypothetical protein